MTEIIQKVPTQSKSELTAGLIRKIVHPLWARRSHPAYARYLREFERSQYLHPDELRALQMRRLRQQLVYAYRYVPFYRLRMTELGMTPLDIQTHEDLHLLPVLTKRDIQDHQDLMTSSDVPVHERIINQTGGSTGSPLQFYVDRKRFDSRMASTDRHNAWAGLRPGDWHAQLWGSRFDLGDEPDPNPDWKQKLIYRNLLLDMGSISEQAMMRYVGVLRKYRPRCLISYAQSAVLFAEFCNRNNICDIAFQSIIVSAEMLLPGQRSVIEQTFGGKVFDRYGCREVSVIASECEYHTGLHINAEALLVEVEPMPHLPKGMGRVLVTDLLNRSMPLIRYEIGDLASLEAETQCPCGRSLPLLGHIEGRSTDFLELPDHRLVSGPSLTLVVADMREVRQVQFVQADLTNVTLKVVAGNGYDHQTEQELRRRLKPYLQEQINLTIVMTDHIPSEPSGKYRFVKNSNNIPAIASAIHG